MRSVQIPESLYLQLEQEASARGIAVDAYVAEVVGEWLGPSEVLGPEALRDLEEAVLEADGGHLLSEEAVDAHFEAKGREWTTNHAA